MERVIATLRGCFGLISTQAALSRDLNSLLPSFFASLLNLSQQKTLLKLVLIALQKLIPEYATTFRPNLEKTSQLTLALIEGDYAPELKRLAAKVYVDLHYSAQKGMNADHWRSCFLGIISEIHTVLDRLFEVVEEGTLTSGV